MKIPYLGKIKFFWCDSCHVPLIREKCGLCLKTGRKIPLTPPGDIRPAFKGDLKQIISVIESQYGDRFSQRFESLVEKQIIFLNKVPYVDRMDEIIIQGDTVGIFRYNLAKGDFEFIPYVELATKLWHHNSKGWLAVDSGAKGPILKGASVLSPGVVFADEDITINDPVIIICENEVIAVGLAKMNGIKMALRRRGVAVKTKYRKKSISVPIKSYIMNWDQIIAANLHSSDIIEKQAIEFIINIAKKHRSHAVAYSGGKDSLVTLDLVYRSGISFEIIFSDTGLEYPETLDNISLIEQKYKQNVVIERNKSWDFWDRFDQFGPPSRDSRWCCKSAKLFPINEILNNLFPDDDKVLTYIGRRRYESVGRSQEPKVSKNPWTPKQVSASPIKDWNAFEVYLYIYKHALQKYLNSLYGLGFIRIGCWLCPASSFADFRITRRIYPFLMNRLNERLREIQLKLDLPEQYVSWGLWRWKYLPQKILDLLKMENVPYSVSNCPDSPNIDLIFKMTSSISPCVHGGFSVFLSSNKILKMTKVKDLAKILGLVVYNEELDVLSISTSRKGKIDVFCDGSIIIKNNDEKTLQKEISSVIRTIYRVIHCDGCGICTYSCKNKALVVKFGTIHVIESLCIHCLNCNDYCPLLKYKDDNTILVPF